MLNSLKANLFSHIANLPGWRTNRKIVVIESDDWGSIRMPSREVYDILLKRGYPVDVCHYNRNDSLESNSDLEQLFEVLTAFKDKNGNHPVITANNIVANPDFQKIKEADFQKYFYEPFTETLKRYPKHDKVYDLIKEGISKGIFYPQFHGREHVNTFSWIDALSKNEKTTREIFDYGMFTVHLKNNLNCRREFLDSLGTHTEKEMLKIKESVVEGLQLFENLWGYQSKSFIATCYIWHPKVEEYLNDFEIKHIQSGRVQKIPLLNREGYKIKRLYTGRKNKLGQIYTCRNVIFEPSENPNKDWINTAMNEIEIVFRWQKPAIICSHRVNYIGFINEENKNRNLKLLKELLTKIIKKWPDTEFMNSSELGALIRN